MTWRPPKMIVEKRRLIGNMPQWPDTTLGNNWACLAKTCTEQNRVVGC
jgi:hypothetical protein